MDIVIATLYPVEGTTIFAPKRSARRPYVGSWGRTYLLALRLDRLILCAANNFIMVVSVANIKTKSILTQFYHRENSVFPSKFLFSFSYEILTNTLYFVYPILCSMGREQRDEKLMQAIGKRLREVRIANGFSQEKVLFDTRIYLTLIETGHRNVSLSTLVKLCRTYGISVHEFFKGMDYEANS